MKRRIIAAVDDLFFAAKIRATAEQLGIEIETGRDTEAILASSRAERPALIIADLQAQRLDPFALARALKADEVLRDVPIVGFYSHVQTEFQAQAKRAGYDQVLPRSVFSKVLPTLLAGEPT
jgi:PleD family two-component response regulator